MLAALLPLLAAPVSAAPLVSFVSPNSGAQLRGEVDIEALATGGVDRVELWIDGGHFSDLAKLGGATYGLSWNTTTWADGPHALSLVAVNLTTGSSTVGLSVITDNHGPLISAITVGYPIGQVTAKQGDRVFVTATVTDAASAVAGVTFDGERVGLDDPLPMYDDGAHNDTLPGDGTYGTTTFGVGVETTGYNLLSVSAADYQGNSRSVPAVMALDNIVPTPKDLRLVLPADQTAIKQGDLVRLHLNVSDSGAGGLKSLGTDIVLTLDNSGSMSAESRDDLAAAAQQIIDLMGERDRVAIFGFGDDSTGLKETAVLWLPFTAMDVDGKQTASAAIVSLLEVQTNTPIWDTIGAAIDYAAAQGADDAVVVAMTDGADWGYDWYNKSSPDDFPDYPVDGIGFERGSESYAPWHTWGEQAFYETHYGQYFVGDISSAQFIDARPHDNDTPFLYPAPGPSTPENFDQDDGWRSGLLDAPVPVFTIGLRLPHNDPILDNSTEYDLWHVATTSGNGQTAGRYFFAPSSTELKGVYEQVATFISLAGDLNLTPPGGIDQVWLDAGSLGQDLPMTLLDDGLHDDGLAGDHTYGSAPFEVRTDETFLAQMRAHVSDLSGNEGSRELSVLVDNVLPVAEMPQWDSLLSPRPHNLPADGDLLLLQAQVHDRDSGVASAQVQLPLGERLNLFNDGNHTDWLPDDDTWGSEPWALATGGVTGMVPMTTMSRDNAGNVAASPSMQLAVNNLGPGELEYLNFTTDGYFTGEVPLGIATAPMGLYQRVTLTIDGVDYIATLDAQGRWSVPLTPEQLGPGRHCINAVAYDLFEDKDPIAQGEVCFEVDLSDPVVVIESPAEGEFLIGLSTLVRTRLSDLEGLDPSSLWVRLDDGPAQPIDVPIPDNGSVAFSLGLQGMGDGGHRISLGVRDLSGRSGQAQVGVIVDRTPPALRMLQGPPPGSTVDLNATPQATVVIEVVESVGLRGVTVALDGGAPAAVVVEPSASGTWSLTLPLSSLSTGRHAFVILATDLAGHDGGLSFEVTIAGGVPIVPPPDPKDPPQRTEEFLGFDGLWLLVLVVVCVTLATVAIDRERRRRRIQGELDHTSAQLGAAEAALADRALPIDQGGPALEEALEAAPPAEQAPRAVVVAEQDPVPEAPISDIAWDHKAEASPLPPAIAAVATPQPPVIEAPRPTAVRCPVCKGVVPVTTHERPAVLTCPTCGTRGRIKA